MASISRVMKDIVDSEHTSAAENLKRLLAVYKESEDLINIGAYKRGTSVEIDEAIFYYPKIVEFFKQSVHENYSAEETIELLNSIVSKGDQ